ncbi:uncharacterized protein LOC127079482 [Lathyrus oleraceus]|uniref:uncharacterized protein LOC127079482 n=1 Tax=Pisum sativum TaxID=3888 RepID=UPI0021CFE751|nr:uncharacterized protein LOC127079482 [Pisum sativum]
MEDEGTEVTWAVFRTNFLEKYFLEDVRSKKPIEFLGLKQGNSAVVECAAKFEELVKFCPQYNSVTYEGSKCIKFESNLCPEIKKGIKYQEIHQFFVLFGKPSHRATECKSNTLTCYNYGERGHISNQFQKPKKAQYVGKVFALTGAETGASDILIQGICYINGTSLIVIIDMGATHSFISSECVKRLNMGVSAMNGNMVINTPTDGSVTTSLVCVNYPLTIYARDFGINFVYLPLIQPDVSSHVTWRTMDRGRKRPKKKKVP